MDNRTAIQRISDCTNYVLSLCLDYEMSAQQVFSKLFAGPRTPRWDEYGATLAKLGNSLDITIGFGMVVHLQNDIGVGLGNGRIDVILEDDGKISFTFTGRVQDKEAVE